MTVMAAKVKLLSITTAILLAMLAVPVLQVSIVEADSPEEVWVAPPPLGSDSNPGTEAQPFATIQWGVDNVGPDGTVHIATGTYHENVVLEESVYLEGAGAPYTIVDGGGLAPVIYIQSTEEFIELFGLTLQNGLGLESTEPALAQAPSQFTGGGGGLFVPPDSFAILADCVVKNNSGNAGGGIANLGVVLLAGCTVSGNTAYEAGGGICNVALFDAGTESGAKVDQFPSGLMLILESTISGNSIPAGEESAYGAGIANAGFLEILDCTVASNTAAGPNSFGGGFYNVGEMDVAATIVANNTAATGNNGYISAGEVYSDGYNIDSEDSCGFDDPTDLVNTNPLLGPLQDNGGPTPTHALHHGSPAIDRIIECSSFFFFVSPLQQKIQSIISPEANLFTQKVNQIFFSFDTDQRGVPRPQGSGCDIGSYELAQASVTPSTGQDTVYFSTLNGYITDLTALGESQIECPAPSNFHFPYGFFSFNVADITPGSTATVVIILPENIPTGTQYWKCLNGQWVDCSSLLGSNDGDSILTLTITDGGLGDRDGSPNGNISDPGGPVLAMGQAGPDVSPTLPRLLNAPLMSVQYLSVSPQQAANNTPVTISANVVNTGDQGGNLNVTLKVNGQVEETRMVSVGPKATQPIKFTVAKSEPGTYAIDIGGQTGSFTVSDSHVNKSAPANTSMIIFLVLAVMAIAVAMVLLLNRRSA